VLSTRVENYQSIFPRPFWLQVSLKMTSQSQLETALSNEIWLRTNPMSALGEPLQQRHNNLVGDGSVKQEQCPGHSRQTGKRPTRHDAKTPPDGSLSIGHRTPRGTGLVVGRRKYLLLVALDLLNFNLTVATRLPIR
jgi:hypothetical protein